MEVESENCVICENSFANEEDSVCVKAKGFSNLISCSLERRDGLFFKYEEGVKVHKKCRSNYVRPSSVKAATANFTSTQDGNNEDSKTVTRNIRNQFYFKTMCMFCGENATKVRKYTVKKVETLEFKESVLNLCIERTDNTADIVRERIGCVHDLVAAEARYHNKCRTSFFKPALQVDRRGRPVDVNRTLAYEKLFNFMENCEDCQYTIRELQELFTEYLNNPNIENYCDKQLIRKLSVDFGDRLIISNIPSEPNVLCLREVSAKLLSQQWKENKNLNDEDGEAKYIIKRAAELVKMQIQSKAFDKNVYPSQSDMMSGGVDDIPDLLKLLIESIVLPVNRPATDISKRKCVSVCNIIMAASRPKSYSSAVLLSIGVYIYRAFGSRELIDILSSLGLCESYKEIEHFVSSAACSAAPEVLPHSFTQFAFDNADHNTRTLDGHDTLHVLGGMQFVSPARHVVIPTAITRPKCPPSMEEVGKFGFIPVTTNCKSEKKALKKIKIFDLSRNKNHPPSTLIPSAAMDMLWMTGRLFHDQPQTGWGGTMSVALQRSKDYEKTYILALPFVNLDPNNPQALHTAMEYSLNQCRKIGQKSCFFTCDLPLYNKSMEIVASADVGSDMSNVIVRLGGFHLLMSFMGSIGYIMGGSGLKELWETIYAGQSVVQMLTGHHFSRSYRAHLLTQHALFITVMKKSEIINNIQDELLVHHTKLVHGELGIEDIESTPVLLDLVNIFRDYMKRAAETSRTAKLWLQYWEQVELIRLYVRAERSGDWQLHIYCVREMLPYFHAAAHLKYARSAHLYVQEMISLPSKISTDEYQLFINNFAVRRTDKHWAGVWSDLAIEQNLMKSMKVRGGLTRGRGTSDATTGKWIAAAPACAGVIHAVETFANFTRSSGSEQHKDLRDASKKREQKDLDIMVNWISSHYPLQPGLQNLVSIASGVCADETTNCDRAQELGVKAMELMEGQNFATVTLSRKNKVKTLDYVNASVKHRDEIVPIKAQQLLNRIVLAATSDQKKKEAIGHELSLHPTSLSDKGELRKSKKSALIPHIVTEKCSTVVPKDTTFVIDGGHLIHRVIWPAKSTYQKIYNTYHNYLLQHYGAHCCVVFDSYVKLSTKSCERKHRQGCRNVRDIVFENDMLQSDSKLTKGEFLSNDKNKQRFIHGLAQHLTTNKFTVYHADDDADYLIVMTAIERSLQSEHVTVVSEDTDVLVLLTQHAKRRSHITLLQPARDGKKDRILEIAAVRRNIRNVRKCLLFCHAVTRCDTTSAIYGMGKVKALNILKQNQDLQNTVAVFTQPRATHDAIKKAGEQFLLKLYKAPPSVQSLDDMRYYTYARTIGRQSLSATFEIASLPPTSHAAAQHSFRVYHQVQTWLGHSLPPTDWGWLEHEDNLVPNLLIENPAPEWVLHMISCGCKTGCTTSKCSCRRTGLHCSTLCLSCQGMDCSNSPPVIIGDDDLV